MSAWLYEGCIREFPFLKFLYGFDLQKALDDTLEINIPMLLIAYLIVTAT